MKSLKFLAATALAVGGLVQEASAQTHVYITGSTAFRSAAINAITAAVNLTGSAKLVTNGGTGNDSTYTNANYPNTQFSGTVTQQTSFIWEGGYIGSGASSQPITVHATFTGSETGICTCLGKEPIPFLTAGSTGTANPSAYLDGQSALPNLTTTSYTDENSNSRTGFYSTSVLVIPDFTFSDVFQATTPFQSGSTLSLGTPFNSGASKYPGATASPTYPTGNDNQVGFVTFKWVASKNFPLRGGSTNVSETPFTGSYTVSNVNVEPNALNALFTGGSIPLSQLTGLTTDQEVQIFATGRNPDSGTRATALADTGIGVTTLVYQYQPQVANSTSTAVIQQAPYPTETIAGITTTQPGNSGEGTGGVLRGYMGFTLPASGLTDEGAHVTAAYYLTYLGTADAGKIAGTGVELSYKGVPFSLQAIYQGQYTFWSIEHIYDRGDLTSPKSTVEGAIITNLENTTTANLSNAGISNLDIYDPLNSQFGPFVSSRSTDGGLISVQFTQ